MPPFLSLPGVTTTSNVGLLHSNKGNTACNVEVKLKKINALVKRTPPCAGRAARAGRLGTAWSLLTSEELPYALDLHLFLGRALRPAPVCSLAAAAEAACQLDAQSSLFGTFPQVRIMQGAGASACMILARSPGMDKQRMLN